MFLINNSPLRKYHTLVVPNVKANNPQVMTRQCLEVALDIMRSTNDQSIRLGYNSPGALASVNHLHIHLLSLPQKLYVEVVVSLKHKLHHRVLLIVIAFISLLGVEETYIKSLQDR